MSSFEYLERQSEIEWLLLRYGARNIVTHEQSKSMREMLYSSNPHDPTGLIMVEEILKGMWPDYQKQVRADNDELRKKYETVSIKNCKKTNWLLCLSFSIFL